MKAKAQAMGSEVNLTASELSSDESKENEVVGYIYNSKTGEIRFITIEQYTGAEALFMDRPTEEDLLKVKSLSERNVRNIKNLSRVDGGIFVVTLGSFLASVTGIILAGSSFLNNAAIFLALMAGLPLTIAIGSFANNIKKVFKKRFPVNYPTSIEVLSINWSHQGFKSLITNKKFELGSPSHKSLVEAAGLSNKAWKLKKSIEQKSARQSEIRSAYKSKALREEQERIGNKLLVLNKELSETEAEIQAILLRDES